LEQVQPTGAFKTWRLRVADNMPVQMHFMANIHLWHMVPYILKASGGVIVLEQSGVGDHVCLLLPSNVSLEKLQGLCKS
jgi:hypothetical protein